MYIDNVAQHKISYNGCGESYSDDPPKNHFKLIIIHYFIYN